MMKGELGRYIWSFKPFKDLTTSDRIVETRFNINGEDISRVCPVDTIKRNKDGSFFIAYTKGDGYIYSEDNLPPDAQYLFVGTSHIKIAEKIEKKIKSIIDEYNIWHNYSGIVKDDVNHPSHYTWLKELCGIEVLDITRHLDFNTGNAVKYLLRAGRKDPKKTIEDLEKAIFYIKDKINMLKNENK